MKSNDLWAAFSASADLESVDNLDNLGNEELTIDIESIDFESSFLPGAEANEQDTINNIESAEAIAETVKASLDKIIQAGTLALENGGFKPAEATAHMDFLKGTLAFVASEEEIAALELPDLEAFGEEGAHIAETQALITAAEDQKAGIGAKLKNAGKAVLEAISKLIYRYFTSLGRLEASVVAVAKEARKVNSVAAKEAKLDLGKYNDAALVDVTKFAVGAAKIANAVPANIPAYSKDEAVKVLTSAGFKAAPAGDGYILKVGNYALAAKPGDKSCTITKASIKSTVSEVPNIKPKAAAAAAITGVRAAKSLAEAASKKLKAAKAEGDEQVAMAKFYGNLLKLMVEKAEYLTRAQAIYAKAAIKDRGGKASTTEEKTEDKKDDTSTKETGGEE